ncbi:MAG TPA: Nif3-like dinuclear metal center hexameric protein [Aeromicrobium sp.]|nr:Nif3-like dinuclear metal center hexameric protein [Aeromicrobium sp.]
MPSLREIVAVLDALYRPEWAEDWDAVGTVVGEPNAEIAKILLAVDPVKSVVDEAVAIGANLIVTHHPLLLRGVTTVAASTPKGRVIHDLIANGVALHTCHTNADSPPLGVSESMARALGLTDVRPLEFEGDAVDKWIVYVPEDDAAKVAAAMHDAGAGVVGDYDRAMFSSRGTGQFRPLAGANPAIGSVGEVETVDEVSLELVAPPASREKVRAALLAAHPYEEVAYDVIATEPRPTGRGSGRIGLLPEPTTLLDFSALVADTLPGHHSATRVAGDPDASVRTVALCGGSGDFLLGAAQAAGADVYVTSDLRHHPVSEHREHPNACAIIDVPHWAAEWTWLPAAARELSERLGDTVEIAVSTIVTDPWTFTVPSRGADAES